MPSCNTYHFTWVSYIGHGVSLNSCSSKAQLLLLTLDGGYLLTAVVPDLQRGMAPLGPPAPVQPLLLGMLLPAPSHGFGHGCLLPAATLGLGLGVAPQGRRPWPWAQGGSSQLQPRAWCGSSGSPSLASGARWLLLAAPDLGRGVSPPGRHWPRTGGSSSPPSPLTSDAG